VHQAAAGARSTRRALLRLVHLRLTGMPPEAPINAIRVWGRRRGSDGARHRRLFASRPPARICERPIEGDRQLRAEAGDDAVVRARCARAASAGGEPLAGSGWSTSSLQSQVPR